MAFRVHSTLMLLRSEDAICTLGSKDAKMVHCSDFKNVKLRKRTKSTKGDCQFKNCKGLRKKVVEQQQEVPRQVTAT
jgi:hypothetical protein